jgi:hypothetical protein
VWFDEDYLKLLDQRNQAKLQSLQDSNQMNGDFLETKNEKMLEIPEIGYRLAY